MGAAVLTGISGAVERSEEGGFSLQGLSVRGLAVRRGGRRLFAGLSFDLAPGEALLLTGPNGSGKSSLLRLLAGFGRPEAGSLAWDGSEIPPDREAHRARLHYIGHQEALKPAMTVVETLNFWRCLGRGKAGGGKEEIAAALSALALDGLAGTRCRLLSSGQRRRLALARLLAWPAPLWLLDEPTVGLDRPSRALVEAMIAAHRQRGGAVMLSTHQEIALGGETRSLDLGAYVAAAVPMPGAGPPAAMEPGLKTGSWSDADWAALDLGDDQEAR